MVTLPPVARHDNITKLIAFALIIEKQADLEHEHPVLDISFGAECSGFIVDKINACPRLVNPADEEIPYEDILIVVPLKIGSGKKVRSEGIDDPCRSDVCRKLPSFDR